MPWSNNTGGPWGQGGNGSGSGNGGGGPWGQGPRGPQRPRGPGNGGGQQPPDLEEILRRSQDRIRNALPGGRGGGTGGPSLSAPIVGVIALALVGLYVFSSAYQIEPDERGIELLFGKPQEEVGPGLHFAFWPFETVERVQIAERKIQVGSTRGSQRQGLMLSGDQNIVNVSFGVLYNVADLQKFLFQVRNPEEVLMEVSESAMREIVGRRPAQDVFRDDKAGIAEEVRQIVQTTMAEYDAGIEVRSIEIEDAAPPAEVADAFDEVQRAEQDEDRFQEEANRERNRILGAARGEAASIREEAAAYKNRVVQEALGEAERFSSVYEEYRKAPEVTRKRLFLETMEEVLADSNKIIVESGTGNGQGVVPYLPLPEVQNQARRNAAGNRNSAGTQGN